MATPPHKVRYEAKATTNRAHKTTSSARLRLAQRPRMILRPMSAFGPKRTCASALHMSAFGCKADMTVCGSPLSRSLLGESGHGLVQCKYLLLTQSGHHGLLETPLPHREQIRLASFGLFKATQIWTLHRTQRAINA